MQIIKDNILKDVLQFCNECIFLTDRDLNFILVNCKLEEILELPSEYIIGKNIKDYILQKDLVLKEKEGKKEVTFMSSTGKKYEYSFNFMIKNCYLEDKKDAVLWIGTPKSDFNFSLFQERLLRLERMAEIGQLAAGIVHEVKNLLAIIDQASGWGKVLVGDNLEKLGSDGEELEKVFEEIENQTQRSSDITNEILTFVRTKHDQHQRVNLIELIENTLRLIRPELKSPLIEIEKRYRHRTNEISSETGLLQQVLINLLTNAIYAIRKKGKPGGKITIITKENENFLKVIIKDNGIGIPEDKQSKIFEFFFTTKPAGEGTGLGLALCKEIMTKLGGDIGFQSKFGEGSEFFITLPKGK